MSTEPTGQDAKAENQADRDADLSALDPSQEVDATIGFDSSASHSRNAESQPFTKQHRDLAFASVLLGSGNLTERQLALAVVNWTAHGHQSLSEHLLNEGLLRSEQLKSLTAAADRKIARSSNDLSRHSDLKNTLREREILKSLDASGRLSKLLGVADATVLSPDEIQSRKIGARYTLLRLLGQGGIGKVWLARDENLRRYVAVKEIKQDVISSDQALAHFRREAEITGQLEHPGIVPVYQYGTDETTGNSFYVMRFLGKRTLQDAISEYHERREAGNAEPMLMHRLLTAFVNVCQALAHAHSHHVIHRDLKPENIAIDSFGQVVLLDWGLAKINDETGMYEVNGQSEPGDLHSVGSTHAGRVLGTPLYMAPEQAAGRLDEVDELSDVFGLGGILYAILTGEAPHEKNIESIQAPNRGRDIFSAIVANKITPPMARVSTVPPELDAICMRALSSKRYLRYDSATALAEDIERYRAGSPVSTYHPPLKKRLTGWMSAHPTLTQLTLLMMAIALLGGILVGMGAKRGRAALQQARYESLTQFAHELDLNLQFEAQELVQDIRFITDFPLMRAITISQQPELDPDVVLDSTIKVSEVTPEEWLERHGLLLDGLLEANPTYLMASTVRFKPPNMTELVRSERLTPGMRARRVPSQRLYSGENPDSDDKMPGLIPGQVLITTADKLPDNVPTRNRSPLVLVAVCPVFDTAGVLFGINVIELDLQDRLENLFLSSARDEIEVLVTDSKGNIVLQHRKGDSPNNLEDQDAVAQDSQLSKLFDGALTRSHYGDGKSMHAVLVRLGGEESDAEIGIITRIAQASD